MGGVEVFVDACFGGVHVAEGCAGGWGMGCGGELGYEVTEFLGDVGGFGVVLEGEVFGRSRRWMKAARRFGWRLWRVSVRLGVGLACRPAEGASRGGRRGELAVADWRAL